MTKPTSTKEVEFLPKSDYQKPGCINPECDNKSMFEALCGKAAIRCCLEFECKTIAADIARASRV